LQTYAEQANWREIQRFLPERFQLRRGQEPKEEWCPGASTEFTSIATETLMRREKSFSFTA
jgi:hypothetical protein